MLYDLHVMLEGCDLLPVSVAYLHLALVILTSPLHPLFYFIYSSSRISFPRVTSDFAYLLRIIIPKPGPRNLKLFVDCYKLLGLDHGFAKFELFSAF